MKKALFILAFGMAVSHSYAGGKGGVQRSDRKIIEITKIVKLSAAQERTIRMAYDAYNAVTDSALYKVNDPVAASRLKYEAGKEFNEKLMNTFTEAQRNRYIRITSAAEVEAKAKYKTDLLAESGEYTADELAEKKAEIFNYLMAEKVVYARDKYNIRKQKENISRLKNTQPRSLRESNIREKQKGQGRIVNGKIRW